MPFERHQQIHPTGIGQRLIVEQEQRRRVVATRHGCGQFGNDRFRGYEHVDLRDRRHMLEHVYESINCPKCRLPLFHKENPPASCVGQPSARQPPSALF
jgi:hypothetical protein